MANNSLTTAKDGVFRHIQRHYQPEEILALTKMYNKAIPTQRERTIVEARVTDITNNEVIVDMNAKSDGVVPISEFKDLPNLKIGDQVEVYIAKKENAKGQLMVSRKSAKLLQAWQALQEAENTQKALQGRVIRKIKGGLVLDLLGLEVFLPGSQIDIQQTTDFDAFVGKQIMVCVVKVNDTKNNVVVSRRRLIEKEQKEQRKKVIANLEKGQILSGRIRNIMPYGLFVDLGGIVGLLHKKDIAWYKKIDDLTTETDETGKPLFKLDQVLNVAVKDFDLDKSYISLSTKLLAWAQLSDDIEENSIVKGIVRQITHNYALVEIAKGVVGLLHISEMTHSNRIKQPDKIVSLHHEIELQVLAIDRSTQELRLGLKQLLPDPWENIQEKYTPNTGYAAVVSEIVKYGTYLELEPGIEGFLPNKYLSWTKRISDSKEILSEGQKLQVMVTHIDQEKKVLELSLRDLEENPWPSFQETFTVGSIHKGTIVAIRNDGAIIELPHGIQTFLPNSALPKATKEEKLAVNSTWEFYVIDFIPEQQKIVLSHVGNKHPQNTTTYQHEDGEQVSATLGDFAVLKQLKQELAAKDKEDKKNLKPKNSK